MREGRLSIPAQLKLLKEYAAANGFAVVQYPAPSRHVNESASRVLSRNNWPQSYLASFGLSSSELDLECLLYLRGQALGITSEETSSIRFSMDCGSVLCIGLTLHRNRLDRGQLVLSGEAREDVGWRQKQRRPDC